MDGVQGSEKGRRETKRTATEQCHSEKEDSDRGTKTKGTAIRGKIRGQWQIEKATVLETEGRGSGDKDRTVTSDRTQI